MRLILANPHSYNFGKTVLNVILRRKNFIKYDYFIKYYFNNKNRDTAIYIDGTRTSFRLIGISFFFPKFFVFLELIVWMIVNKMNPFRHKIYFSINKLDKDKDILVNFSRSFGNTHNKKLNNFKGISFIFFSHYFTDTKKVSECLKKISNYVAVAESDLSNVGYFKSFFPFVEEVYQLPFTFGERFIPLNDFKDRNNKCLALGSRCVINDKNFIDYFGSGTLHPMREILYKNSKRYPQEIDSIINPTDKVIKSKDSINVPLFLRVIKKYLPYVILERIFGTKQSEYFKFDIVKKYNEYKMFVCPEEIVGLPSINAIEGMACGSAYIGIDDPMYTNLGLVPGIHYITYKENDLDDLISKIKYYQNNPELLQKIAAEGCKFVRDNFNKKNVSEILWNDLETIHRRFLIDKKINLVCSFRKK